MSDEPILGYRSNGDPIYECKKGYIYTAAVIACNKCNAFIRGMGGPAFGSLCIRCHENQMNIEVFLKEKESK